MATLYHSWEFTSESTVNDLYRNKCWDRFARPQFSHFSRHMMDVHSTKQIWDLYRVLWQNLEDWDRAGQEYVLSSCRYSSGYRQQLKLFMFAHYNYSGVVAHCCMYYHE